MARFTGTGANETISPEFVSSTVTSDPPGFLPGDGIDTLAGHAGNDTLDSGGGNDRLNGGRGVDALSGGAGDDFYVVDNNADMVLEAVGEGIDTVLALANYTLPAGAEIEFVYAKAGVQGSLGLALTGNSFANHLIGYDGNDTLTGGGGNDVLRGRIGDDTLKGGLGDDAYYVEDAGDVVVESQSEGTDTVYAGISYSLALGQGIEVLRAHAGSIGLTLAGNEFSTTIIGGAGGDTLSDFNKDYKDRAFFGHAGDDTILAGVGYDFMNGGDGADRLDGDGSDDRLFGGDGDDKLVGGFGADRLNGGSGNDILQGGADTDVMIGGTGDDTLIFRGSDDLMKGGIGSDTYFIGRYVRPAPPHVVEKVGEGNDTIYASFNFDLPVGQEIESLLAKTGAGDLQLRGNAFDNIVGGGAGDDKLSGSTGDDQVYGGIGNDRLSGSKGDDTLSGDAGNDTLNGGIGNNVLTGGGDADTFQFDSPLVAGDVSQITDLAPGLDRIALASWIFTALGSAGPLSPDAFHTGNAANDLDDRIIYDAGTGKLFYDSDGSGSGASIQFATVSSGLALTNSDFVVV